MYNRKSNNSRSNNNCIYDNNIFTPDLNIGLPDISIMSYYQNFPTGVISLTDVAGPLTLIDDV